MSKEQAPDSVREMTADNIMRVLPSVLYNDEGMNTLAKTVGLSIDDLKSDFENAAIYCRIDKLSEALLDLLAEDLRLYWYDYEADLEEKQRIVKSGWYVHQHLGTVGAMKQALSDIWPETEVQEWYQYSGDPGHFKVVLRIAEGSVDPDLITKKIDQFKNVRSVLDEILYTGMDCEVNVYAWLADCGLALVENCTMF